MKLVTKYLLIEVVNSVWKVRNSRPFNSKEEAWDWTDRHYHKDEDRLRFYLFPVEMDATIEQL